MIYDDYDIEYKKLVESKPCKYQPRGECLEPRHCDYSYDCEVKKYIKRWKK
jgi:hypothetical protein